LVFFDSTDETAKSSPRCAAALQRALHIIENFGGSSFSQTLRHFLLRSSTLVILRLSPVFTASSKSICNLKSTASSFNFNTSPLRCASSSSLSEYPHQHVGFLRGSHAIGDCHSPDLTQHTAPRRFSAARLSQSR
jgi:hypothetical protein